MNPRGGGHNDYFLIPNNLVFSFPDTMIATIALILAFYKDSEKDIQG